MTSGNAPIIRAARSADLERVLRAYTRAFADEAVATWAGLDGQSSAIYHDSLARALDQDEILVAEQHGDLVGVSVWLTVDSTDRIHQEATELTELATTHPELTRMATAVRLVVERHPESPHLYLSSMGVVPAARGRGVGGAMLRHRLVLADHQRLPAYLEASTPASQRLYARHGFRLLGPSITFPEDGPQPQPMWRDCSGEAH